MPRGGRVSMASADFYLQQRLQLAQPLLHGLLLEGSRRARSRARRGRFERGVVLLLR